MLERPPVIRWMGIYAWAMVALYLAVVALFVVGYDKLATTPEFEDFPLRLYLFVCLGIAVPFGLWAFLPHRPWVWVYGLVLIAIGLGSCLTLPFCVYLLIKWIDPRAREWYTTEPA